jgi:hypothetical protein
VSRQLTLFGLEEVRSCEQWRSANVLGGESLLELDLVVVCAMNRDFRGLRQSPIKSDGLRSCLFADGINLLGLVHACWWERSPEECVE